MTWGRLSPLDFCTIANSILLLSYNKHFCKVFGPEKVRLESIVHEFNDLKSRVSKRLDNERVLSGQERTAHAWFCDYTQGTYDALTGEFVAKYPEKYEMVAQIEMPNSLSDPTHWGHLAWLFCEFMDSLDNDPK